MQNAKCKMQNFGRFSYENRFYCIREDDIFPYKLSFVRYVSPLLLNPHNTMVERTMLIKT